MYKVFIQNNSISFIEKINTTNLEGFIVNENYFNAHNQQIRELLNNSDFSIAIFVVCNTPQSVFDAFFASYEKVTAAGGIVVCGEKVAIINRHDKWDLPKGKVEENETIETAAIREIEEETGITKLQLKQHLIDTYHTYDTYGPDTLKRTVWFVVSTDELQQGIPQAEESISEVRWVNRNELNSYISTSYLSLKEVVQEFEKE